MLRSVLSKILLTFFVIIGLFSCAEELEENPAPAFTFTISDAIAGQVSFYNATKGATQYLWSFGDGTTSTEANPVHVYKSNGTYQVTLKLPGNTGVKFPRNSDGGTQVSQMLTITNAGSVISAQMQGANRFTFSSVSATATKGNGVIELFGQNTLGSYFRIVIPDNAATGGSYSVFPGQPSISKASFEYYQTNTGPAYANLNGCNNASGTVTIANISNNSISGNFTARMFNPDCVRFFEAISGNFSCSF